MSYNKTLSKSNTKNMKKPTTKYIQIILILCINILLTYTIANSSINSVILETNKQSNSTPSNLLQPQSELLLRITKTHLALGQKKQYNIPKTNILSFLQKLEKLALLDPIELIEFNPNKKESLQNYIHTSQDAINKSDIIITELQQEVQILKPEIEECLNAKTNADHDFFENLNSYSQTHMEEAIQESIKQWKCATEKRIIHNTQIEILNRLQYYQSLLSQKATYLEKEQDLIIKHRDVIKDDLLYKLNSIKENLSIN